MKKLLVAISMMLVFGITSAAISFASGSFANSDVGNVSGGGGIVELARGSLGLRGSSAEGGDFAYAQGTGVTGYYTLPVATGASLLAAGPDGYAPAAQGVGLSFEDWLHRAAQENAQRTAPAAYVDSVGDGARHAYSVPSPAPGIQGLGTASPNAGGGASQAALLLSDSGLIAAVPEPETYALLLIGLGLITVVARRRQPS